MTVGYKDILASGDSDKYPACRLDLCLNCGADWYTHQGWVCKAAFIMGFSTLFSHAPSDRRFLTKEMADSVPDGILKPVKYWSKPNYVAGVWTGNATIETSAKVDPMLMRAHVHGGGLGPPPPNKKDTDLSDWRAWRDVNRRSDECPCGTSRKVCPYHA